MKKSAIAYTLVGTLTLCVSVIAVRFNCPTTALTMLIMTALSWSIARMEWAEVRKGGKS